MNRAPGSLTEPHPLAAALAYAALGLPVFPCKGGSKEPATGHGFHDATTEAGRIRELFRAGHNIGTPGTPGALIVDFDVSKDERIPLAQRRADTRQVLRMMEDTFPEVAAAPLHGTPSGGYHAFLCLPPGTPRLVTGAWPRGAERTYGELRGMARAYVVLPPSSTPVGTYTVLRPLVHIEDLPVASSGLLKYLSPPPRRQRRKAPRVSGQANRVEQLQRLAETVRRTPPDTARNVNLNRSAFIAGLMIAAGELDEATAEHELMAAALDAGLPQREAERTLASGLTAGQREGGR